MPILKLNQLLTMTVIFLEAQFPVRDAVEAINGVDFRVRWP